MKHRIIPFLALALLYVTATAQGEWKWAHYWTGQDGNSPGDYYNKIINTAFDDEGNIYVYGTMGGSAAFDGNTFAFSSDAEVLNGHMRPSLLAKFDTTGNMQWYKVVKCSHSEAVPLWMEVVDDKVFVSGDCSIYGSNANAWLYYMDTLITKYQISSIPQNIQKPPFAFGHWTWFAQFDLNGNLLDNHFAQTFSRESLYGNRLVGSLTNSVLPTPCHTDNDGNYYIFTPIQYYGVESAPYTIVVDGDSDKTYDIYLPGNADPSCTQSCLNNAMLYKFSPDGDLLFAKTLVDSTDGIAPSYNICDTINRYFYTYFKGMSFDEDDNMYVSGYVRLAQHLNGQGGELHEYPVHIWWDSTHCLTINDISSAAYCNFIIKYDTSGNVVWCNQAYTRVASSDIFAQTHFYGSSVHDNSVFVCGDAEDLFNAVSVIYFNNDTDDFIDRFAPEQQTRGFYVEFDRNNGSYVRHSIIPNNTLSVLGQNSFAKPAVSNNQIVISASVDFSDKKFGLARWCTSGDFIDYTPITSFPDQMIGTGPTILNDNGFVIVSPQIKGSIAFSEDVVVNGDAEHSNAVFALYHDPRFAQPFVPDDTVGIDDYYRNRESDIYLYPNPTHGTTTVCGYMYGYQNIELYDLQGRKLGDLVGNGSQIPTLDLTPYPAGTYLVKINFARGVSVTRKVVKME